LTLLARKQNCLNAYCKGVGNALYSGNEEERVRITDLE